MSLQGRKALLPALAFSLISVAFTWLLWSSGLLYSLEARTWDLRSRLLAAPSAVTSDIILVLLDQQSLDWVKENLGIGWPWPRELHGAIINSCRRRGAKAVAVDILFTEPSFFGISDDQALASACRATASLAMGSVSAGPGSGHTSTWPAGVKKPAALADPDRLLPHYERALFPIHEVAASSKVLCNVHQQADEDGIFRAFHPFVFFDEIPLPALGVGTYLAAFPKTAPHFNGQQIVLGPRHIPLDHNGRMILRYRGPSFATYKALSAAPLIRDELLLVQGERDKTAVQRDLRDKYVFYGLSAPGLMDLRPTPVGGKTTGVEIHATTLDNLLTGDFITPLSRKGQFLFSCLSCLAIALLCLRFQSPGQLTLISLGGVAAPLLLPFAAYRAGYELYLVPFFLANALCLSSIILFNYLQEREKRHFIKHSFKHYLSPHVIDELIKNPDKLKLGGERREISIFFSDLQDFTFISEGLEPEALTSLLNDYLTAMTDIIQEEQGTVDKYEGDAIIAFWNAPLDIPDHGLRCVRAALRCQTELARLRPRFKKQCGHELRMRIGINTGTAVVGNLGSARRFDYTMLGDAVNLAARLEGANKQFGTFTMMSAATEKLIRGHFPCRELARLTVVGRREAVTVFEPFLPENFAARKQSLESFRQGLQLFYAGDFQEAMILFGQHSETDAAARCYLEKCRLLLQENVDTRQWQGVWQLTSK